MNNYPVQHPVSPLTRAQMRQLMADLNQARVATLKKGRTNLSYIEAWDARRSMIRIFGYGGFSTRVINTRTIYQEQDVAATEYSQSKDAPKVQKVERLLVPTMQRNPETGETRVVNVETLKPVFNWRVAMEVTYEVYVHQLGAVYTDTGVAGQVGPDIGEAADFAVKTASSDTFKRCVINLGTQFGLSLYASQGDKVEYGDVVNKVIAPGQRQIDVDWAAFEQANLDLERSTKLEAERAKQGGPQGGAPAGREEQPVEGAAPTEEETAAATAALAGGFGQQS
jgi:recombination DNA repair RAD52 pathway protein